MTRARITLYVTVSLLIIGAIFLIIYNNSQGGLGTTEQTKAVASDVATTSLEEVSLSPEKRSENMESDISSTSSPSKPILNSEPKPQNQKVPLKLVKTEVTPISFDSSAMLAAHNAVRKNVKIAPLVYSQTLAQSAQKWSDKLQVDNCNLKHDIKTPYGENLYWTSRTGSLKPGLTTTPAMVVAAWAAEATYYSRSKNSCAAGEICGHYTQIVWENTTEVGCGVSICSQENQQTEVWVCRYNPPGNYVSEKPY